MPLAMADFSVGHSAVGSVADTMRMLAPLMIDAWMAGSSDAGVAAVPLVSVPVSPSVWSAAIAPPDFALSAIVKYCAPRSLGTTKAFSPVFSPPESDEPDEPDPDPDPEDVELLHAASVAEATSTTAEAKRRLFAERLI